MRVGVLLIKSFILVFCLVLYWMCSKNTEEAEWAAAVQTVDGIKVVTNPEEPKYGAFEFDLEEDLVIGDVNNENYFFQGRVGLNVDDDGNIFVRDGKNRRIQKYSRDGTFIRTIGRQGQGPGEYIYPSRLFLDDAGNPIVHDSRSLIYYDRDGVFQKRVVIKNLYSRFLPGPNGTFLGTTQPNPRIEGEAKKSIIQVGENGEPLRTIADYPISYSESQKAVVLHWYTHSVNLARRTADSFYYGFSKEYKVNVAGSDGNTTFIFSKKAKPQTISTEEEELTRKDGFVAALGTNEPEKAIVFPKEQPFFKSFMSDDSGRLYIVLFDSILRRDEQMAKVDVFSKEGFYLYQMDWTFFPALIKNGTLYHVRENDETGDIQVVRYKIMNWESLNEQ